MSIKTVSSSNIAPRDIPSPIIPVIVNNVTPTTWVRPSDWLTLPTVTSTNQKFAGLLAITNDDTNTIAFTATTSAGTYTVDWGDGSATQTFASGAIAQKLFDYASISASTISTQGYKQTIITITPTTGNLVSINLQTKYVNVPVLGQYTAKWLDIIVGSPSMTSMILGGYPSQTVQVAWLQQFQLMSTATSFTSLNFGYCSALQSIPTFNLSNMTSAVYNGQGLFIGCRNLQTGPSIDLSKFSTLAQAFQECYNLLSTPASYSNSSNVTNTSQMFNSCYNLRSVAALDVSKVTDCNSMFINCTSLQTVPIFNFSSLLTTTASMFQGCLALTNMPLFNTINVSVASSMFNGCNSLQTVPLFNFANVTAAGSMFAACFNLKTVPRLNLSKATSTTSMFLNNYALTNVSLITTGALLDTTSMFSGCQSLSSAPLFETGNVTVMTSMFNGCYNLNNVPLYDMTKNTSIAGMFTNCFSLKSVPLWNTSNVTNISSAFANCRSIQNLSFFDTTKVTNGLQAFNGCTALVSIPTFVFSNILSGQQMFNGCSSLISVPAFNFANCTTSNGMFAQTSSLTSVQALTYPKVTDASSMFLNSTALRSIGDMTIPNVTTITNMFNGANNIASIGNINFGNTTTGSPLSGCNALATCNISNIKLTITFNSTSMGKIALENVFSNLVSNTTGQTITIGSSIGASAAVSLAGTWNNASNIVTMTNTTGLLANMTVTGANLSGNLSISTLANSKVAVNSYAQSNTMMRMYTATGGLTANTPYYLSNGAVVGSTYYYDVSNAVGATPLTLTAAGPANGQFDVRIASINTNANIVLTAWPNGNASATTFSSRNLNTNLVTFKNWTLSG